MSTRFRHLIKLSEEALEEGPRRSRLAMLLGGVGGAAGGAILGAGIGDVHDDRRVRRQMQAFQDYERELALHNASKMDAATARLENARIDHAARRLDRQRRRIQRVENALKSESLRHRGGLAPYTPPDLSSLNDPRTRISMTPGQRRVQTERNLLSKMERSPNTYPQGPRVPVPPVLPAPEFPNGPLLTRSVATRGARWGARGGLGLGAALGVLAASRLQRTPTEED